MTRHRVTHLICIFLLLFAQQSAFTHAAWHHAHEHSPAHHQDQDDASFQGELCGLHGAFSQVLGGVQTAVVHHLLPQRIAGTIAHRPGACIVPELHVPLSRGPPVLS
jgi:hypothetical protein